MLPQNWRQLVSNVEFNTSTDNLRSNPYEMEHVPEAETLAALLHDHDPSEADDGAEYAEYAEAGEDVVNPDAPANINEDDELPPYSIYARLFRPEKSVKYPIIACGHKLRGEFEPNHRNCERCWFTYFQIHGELTQAVEEAFQKGGAGLIIRLKGKTFLHNFLKFMSTVALIKQQQEAAKENIESTTGYGSDKSLREDETPAYIGGGSVAD